MGRPKWAGAHGSDFSDNSYFRHGILLRFREGPRAGLAKLSRARPGPPKSALPNKSVPEAQILVEIRAPIADRVPNDPASYREPLAQTPETHVNEEWKRRSSLGAPTSAGQPAPQVATTSRARRGRRKTSGCGFVARAGGGSTRPFPCARPALRVNGLRGQGRLPAGDRARAPLRGIHRRGARSQASSKRSTSSKGWTKAGKRQLALGSRCPKFENDLGVGSVVRPRVVDRGVTRERPEIRR